MTEETKKNKIFSEHALFANKDNFGPLQGVTRPLVEWPWPEQLNVGRRCLPFQKQKRNNTTFNLHDNNRLMVIPLRCGGAHMETFAH